MKKLAILGIFWLIIFYPSLIFANFSDKIIENTKSAVVALYTDENLEYLRASGFFIDSSGTVITAEHAVKNYPRLWARLYDGRKLELIPVLFQESDDLAIMLPKISENEKTAFPYLKFGDIDNLAIGKPIMVIGNSLSGLWQVLYGNIENLRREIIVENGYPIPKNFNFTIEYSIIISKGFSGSPLTDKNGDVLGINISVTKISLGENLSYAISLLKIKSFIEEFYRKFPKLIKKF